MSRRGGRNRPPRLDDLPRSGAAGPVDASRRASPGASGAAPPTLRRSLVQGGVAGAPGRHGREEVASTVRHLVEGDPRARLGLDLQGVTRPEVADAVAAVWGWDGRGSRAPIDPDCTVRGAHALGERLLEVATAGGRVAFATARPASLLPALSRLAAGAREAGATILDCADYGPLSPPRQPPRRLWWHGGVAVVTDGERLLADERPETGAEWLFAVGRPDLVVADHGFAGAAAAAGVEAFALADLDAVAFGVAAGRGTPLVVVPLDDRCPPAAYGPLVDAVLGTRPLAQESHSTTPVPGPYAPADSGAEG